MYVILGATGNTGSIVAETLLAKKQKVRVVGRSKERLSRFVSQGAEAVVAEFTDSAALTRAFKGARGVYAMLPPDIANLHYRGHQDEVTNSIATALEAAGVTHVVTLSSYGADKADKTGPVVGLYVLEQRLAGIPRLNALHLRAGYFMENTLPQAGMIRSMGKMGGPVRADLALPAVATHDIGSFAAEALLKLDFRAQQTRELQGQRDLTYQEMAKIVGAAIGKPDLTYVQLPNEQVIQGMTQMGMSKDFATLICEMAEALNSGYMRMLEPRSAANTTPTSYEEFVRKVFVPAYKGSAAKA